MTTAPARRSSPTGVTLRWNQRSSVGEGQEYSIAKSLASPCNTRRMPIAAALCLLGAIAAGAVADVKVVAPHADIGALQHVGRGGAPPRLVHGHDHPVRIDQGDMRRQGIEDGGLCLCGLTPGRVGGARLSFGLAEGVGRKSDPGHFRIR